MFHLLYHKGVKEEQGLLHETVIHATGLVLVRSCKLSVVSLLGWEKNLAFGCSSEFIRIVILIVITRIISAVYISNIDVYEMYIYIYTLYT